MVYLVPQNGDLPWETSSIIHFDVQCGKFLEVIWSILESMTCEYILRIFVYYVDMNDLHLCMVHLPCPRLTKNSWHHEKSLSWLGTKRTKFDHHQISQISSCLRVICYQAAATKRALKLQVVVPSPFRHWKAHLRKISGLRHTSQAIGNHPKNESAVDWNVSFTHKHLQCCAGIEMTCDYEQWATSHSFGWS